MISKMFRMTKDDIKETLNNPKATTMELIIAKIMVEAVNKGDYSRVNALWDRSIGKVTDKIQHSTARPTVMKLINEEAVMVFGPLPEKDE